MAYSMKRNENLPTEVFYLVGCVLVYRYTKDRNINELRHNSMYGYEKNKNSPLYWYTRTAPIWCYAGGKFDPQFDRNANVDIQTIQTLLSLIEGEHHVSRAHSRASERYCQRAPFCARIPRKYRFTIENLSTSEYCPQGT